MEIDLGHLKQMKLGEDYKEGYNVKVKRFNRSERLGKWVFGGFRRAHRREFVEYARLFGENLQYTKW
jgi:hypothetical protein